MVIIGLRKVKKVGRGRGPRLHYHSWEVAELLGVSDRTIQRWCKEDTGKTLPKLSMKELYLFINKNIQ